MDSDNEILDRAFDDCAEAMGYVDVDDFTQEQKSNPEEFRRRLRALKEK